MLKRISMLRIPLSSKLAALTTIVFALSGLVVLAALLTLSASAALTPVDIVWLMASCAAVLVPMHFLVLNHIGRMFITRPLEDLAETARDLGNTPLPKNIPVEVELDELTVALVRSGEALNDQIRGLTRECETFRRLVDHLPGFISVQNREFRVSNLNSAFRETFTVRQGDLCPCSCTSTTPGHECPVSQTFADGQPRISEHTGAYPDGTAARWLIATMPMVDEHGTVTHVVEQRIDITDKVSA